MTSLFLLNLFLATLYLFLSGDFSFFNLLIGLGLGALIVTITARTRPDGLRYGRRLGQLLRFSLYFLKILALSNLAVARSILWPRRYPLRPRLIHYPVAGLSAAEITTLASAITLTPGTLTADIDDAGAYLVIHAMNAADLPAAMADLDELRHRLLTEVFGR